jgi:hypothetical protein
MAQQTINVGTSPNDGTGTPLRTAFQYTNSNFSELYTAVGPSGNNIVVPGTATITGDLTVDTNVLKVDTSNNRVGICTASPALPFVVSNAGAQGFEINPTGSIISGGIDILSYNRSTSLYKGAGFGAESYLFRIGTSSLSDAMTLNATGLGVGVTPTQRFHIKLDQNAYTYARVENQNTSSGAFAGLMLAASGNTWGIANGSTAANSNSLAFYNDAGGTNSVKMLIDSSGNVGVGVTPSAWTIGKAIEVGGVGNALWWPASADLRVMNNAYFASSQYKYGVTGYAGMYQLQNGQHQWHNAPSGTAGNPISGANAFVQAMTLDASGNLLLGGTSQIASCRSSITNAGGDQLAINATNTSTGQSAIKFCNAGTAYGYIWWDKSDSRLYVQNTSGGVYLASTATSWTANSDERLKDIIEPISNAVSKVGSLRAIIGKYKNDQTNTRRSFLIAQDVQSVLPEAVDASNPDQLGVAYTDVIPLLVAAIKELTARVQTLEAK